MAFQIVGEDTEVLMELAEEAIAAHRGHPRPGATCETRHAEAQQELHIEPDRDLASALRHLARTRWPRWWA